MCVGNAKAPPSTMNLSPPVPQIKAFFFHLKIGNNEISLGFDFSCCSRHYGTLNKSSDLFALQFIKANKIGFFSSLCFRAKDQGS